MKTWEEYTVNEQRKLTSLANYPIHSASVVWMKRVHAAAELQRR